MSNTDSRNDTTRTSSRGKWGAAIFGIIAVPGGAIALNQPLAAAADIVVYKSPTRGCRGKWVDHPRANGLSVSVRERGNLQPVENRMVAPHPLRSCHTAEIDGYVIEGHVPADLISRLLRERSPIQAGPRHLTRSGAGACSENRREYLPVGSASASMPPKFSDQATAPLFQRFTALDDVALPIQGLAVAGMPMGSPGMEGPRGDAYDIVAFRDSGVTIVYGGR